MYESKIKYIHIEVLGYDALHTCYDAYQCFILHYLYKYICHFLPILIPLEIVVTCQYWYLATSPQWSVPKSVLMLPFKGSTFPFAGSDGVEGNRQHLETEAWTHGLLEGDCGDDQA